MAKKKRAKSKDELGDNIPMTPTFPLVRSLTAHNFEYLETASIKNESILHC